MEANVYDFDETIFDGDSTKKFYLHLLLRQPKIARHLPKQSFYFILFSLGFIQKTKFKQKFYSCFKDVDDIDREVKNFWQKNKKRIKSFYIENKKENDIIISASPEFLLKPICRELGIKYVIASRVDKKTGKYKGLNCYGAEKVVRLNEKFKNVKIKEFYSDSFSDEPLARLAEKSYIVVKNNIYPWWEYKKKCTN